jgi:large subunit ribosomal protein L10
MLAARQALNLSVSAAYPTADNIRTIIAKATTESRNLGIYAVVLEPDIMDALLGKAYSQMIAVASAASDVNEEAIDDELKETLGARATSAAVATEATETVEEKEEEEENSEEEGMAGLGALFG